MNIDKAAQATRKYFVACLRVYDRADIAYEYGIGPFSSPEEAQSACNRWNLHAVLEEIWDPSPATCMSAVEWQEDPDNDDGSPYSVAGIYRAMIDALIDDVKAVL